MNETDQKEFVQLLAYLTDSKTNADLEKAIQTLGEDNLKDLTNKYKQLKAAYNEVEQKKIMDEMKSTCDMALKKTMAKFGAKLNYIQALKNRCPEGTQLYKVGGRVECKKCGGSAVKPVGKKRFQGGGEFPEEADVNIPYGIYHPVQDPNPSLRIHLPYSDKNYSSKLDIIEFDNNSRLPVHPKSVARYIHTTPLNKDTFYVVTPPVYTTRQLENTYGEKIFNKAVEKLSKNKK